MPPQLPHSFTLNCVIFDLMRVLNLTDVLHCELPDVQAGFRKGRGTRDQIANIRWIIEKAREFQKNIYFCFIDYAKAFVWITINWKILKEMPFRPLIGLQELRVPTREDSGVLCFLPLETRCDPPGETGMRPRYPCRPWRGTLRPGPKPR